MGGEQIEALSAIGICPAGQNRIASWWQRVAEGCPRHAPVADHQSGYYAHGTTPYAPAPGMVCVQNARMAVGRIPGWQPTLRQALAWARDRERRRR